MRYWFSSVPSQAITESSLHQIHQEVERLCWFVIRGDDESWSQFRLGFIQSFFAEQMHWWSSAFSAFDCTNFVPCSKRNKAQKKTNESIKLAVARSTDWRQQFNLINCLLISLFSHCHLLFLHLGTLLRTFLRSNSVKMSICAIYHVVLTFSSGVSETIV